MQEPNTNQFEDSPNGQNKIKVSFDFNQIYYAESNIQPKDLMDETARLLEKCEPLNHSRILNELVLQFENLDFESLANPKQIENFKLNNKHFLVLAVENVLAIAEKNRWGLCRNNDFIYLYNGTFWSELERETFQKFLGEAAENMGIAKFDARYFLFREQLFKQFLASAYLPTPEVNDKKVQINLKNGTFEISVNGNQIKPFDRSDFLTYQLPFEYNPTSKAPLFQSYLDRVLPDKERQRVLSEYLGYVFIKHGNGTLKEEKALVLYGTGANGKSVFFEIVNALLGAENVSSFSLQSLTNENGYFRAKLSNKLVNYASEINGNLEASIFKQLVSGEPVEARLPYGQPFTLKQYAKLIFNCNELPKDIEHTNAYFRRFLIIPFDVTIPSEEQDKELHIKIIESELSGVFNWVLDGLSRLLKQKRFSECEAAKKAVEQYRIESDSVQLFLSEYGYRVSTVLEVPLKELYSDYRTFCLENGFKSCSSRTFSDRLRNSGFQATRRNYGYVVHAEKISSF